MFARPNSVRNAKRSREPQPAEKDPDTKALGSRAFPICLGLKVQILDKGEKGGELRIAYKTLEQLDDIMPPSEQKRQTLRSRDIKQIVMT